MARLSGKFPSVRHVNQLRLTDIEFQKDTLNTNISNSDSNTLNGCQKFEEEKQYYPFILPPTKVTVPVTNGTKVPSISRTPTETLESTENNTRFQVRNTTVQPTRMKLL